MVKSGFSLAPWKIKFECLHEQLHLHVRVYNKQKMQGNMKIPTRKTSTKENSYPG